MVWFFGQNLPKCRQFCLKFWAVMKCKIMHQICYGFYWRVKIWSKLGEKKLIFWLILRGFLFTPSYILWVTRQYFDKWKTLLRYMFVVSFISIAVVVAKLKFSKVFCSTSESTKGPPFFGGGLGVGVGLGLYSPILVEIWPEAVSNKKNNV